VIRAALEKFPPDPDPPLYVLILGSRMPEGDLVEGIPRYALDDSRAFIEKHRPLLDAARSLFGELADVGITMKEVTDQLQRDGVELFAASFDELLTNLAAREASGCTKRVMTN